MPSFTRCPNHRQAKTLNAYGCLSPSVWGAAGTARSYPCSSRLQTVLAVHRDSEVVITLTREEPSRAGEALTLAFPKAVSGEGRNSALLSQAALDTLKTRVS